MATSVYFNSSAIGGTQEQFLMEDLINETIKNNGIDVYVIPYESVNGIDLVYGENPLKYFDDSYLIEMYIVDNVEYTGPREFFSKFGLEIRDNMMIQVARRAYTKYIPDKYQRSGGGPREGDLIWIPLTNSLMSIKNVEGEKDFFMLGRKKPYFFELSCERFRFNNEQFNTGLSTLDQNMKEHSYVVTLSLGNLTGSFMIGENVYQMAANTTANVSLATNIAQVVSFDINDMSMNVAHTKGAITHSLPIYGQDSLAQATVLSYDDLSDGRRDDIVENKILEDEANSIINFSEQNPFGTV